MRPQSARQDGLVLIVSLVIVVGLVGMSAVYLGRTLHETRRQGLQEDSMNALYGAYGKMARAEAILNRAGYDDETGRNLALAAALEKPDHTIEDTGVLVEPIGDPADTVYFNLTAEDKVNRVLRRVRVLIREKESFADYNYFVNSHPLGISGNPTPRGSIHTNRNLDFYFADGKFVDPVTASEGFGYQAGATEENTTFLGEFNPHAEPVTELTNVDISKMKKIASYTVADTNMDVRIELDGDKIRVQQWTKDGEYEQAQYKTNKVKVGEEPVTVKKETKHYKTETYWETENIYEKQKVTYYEKEPIYEYKTETYWKTEPVYETKKVKKTKKVPVYKTVTVTKYKTEKVWVEDPGGNTGGGTDIAGGGGGTPGHWESVKVPYQTTEKVVDHYNNETYYVEEKVKVGEEKVKATKTTKVKVGEKQVEKTKTETVKVGEKKVEKTREVYDHSTWKTVTELQPVYEEEKVFDGYKTVKQKAEKVSDETIPAKGVVYVEGDITQLEGELNGNVTIASNGRIYVTGSLVYEDADRDPAYLNGDKDDKPYEPNPDYDGASVLGVIADGDILYTEDVPKMFELNGSFLSRTGRVGITGIVLDEAGNVSPAE